MTRRWTLWLVGLALIALVGLFPLRLALGVGELDRIGIAARQVGGTVWYGRINDAALGRQPLGSFDVALSPFALLTGRAVVAFERIENGDGPLTGTLRAGGDLRGVHGVDGRLAVAGLFAPLPVAAIELEEATVLFRGSRCAEASGVVRALVGAELAGINLTRPLVGRLACDGERVRLDMVSAGGSERIDFYVGSDGRYRVWMQVRATDPLVATGLGLLGFQPAPGGLGLSTEGQL